MGLASFAEGVDLPGDYCKHVVIAKLPFVVPDDPLHEVLSSGSSKMAAIHFLICHCPLHPCA